MCQQVDRHERSNQLTVWILEYGKTYHVGHLPTFECDLLLRRGSGREAWAASNALCMMILFMDTIYY